jgi:hypothetical protein
MSVASILDCIDSVLRPRAERRKATLHGTRPDGTPQRHPSEGCP